jgi:exodeoxyribonuclease V alpha subunit
MSTMDLPERDILLANGFAARIKAWAQAQAGADKLDGDAARRLYRAAWHASRATSNGHVCLPLAQLTELESEDGLDSAGWRLLLLDSGVVGTPESPQARPLLLDGGDRLYLHKYYALEQALARRFLQASDFVDAPRADTIALLEQLFAKSSQHEGPDWQKLAAALALLRRVCIISGGPGTGKTTTVANILACLLQQQADCRIVLAAPTGKAAARMLDALQARATQIPAELAARFPRQAYTVHRLLGTTDAPGVFRHNASRPLACDVLVVDEASMLDLALAARLFDAVPATARIIMLGDQDQLAAVEAGAVFSDLSANPGLSPGLLASLAQITGIDLRPLDAPCARGAGLPDSTVWLARNYRYGADSAIGRLAALVVSGDAPALLHWLQQGPHAELDWLAQDDEAADGEIVARALAEYDFYAETVRRHEAEPALVFAAFERFRVLCALRNTTRGVDALNQALESRLKPLLPASMAATPWYPGRPVIVTRNDYSLRLFNGDVGIALRDGAGRLRVVFQDRELGYREVATGRLPEHAPAYALTVHRSQGSEFDRVMVVMPAVEARVATRELLYTAVTRARSGLVLCGGSGVLTAAVETAGVRRSGLEQRLQEREG